MLKSFLNHGFFSTQERNFLELWRLTYHVMSYKTVSSLCLLLHCKYLDVPLIGVERNVVITINLYFILFSLSSFE